MRFLIYIFLIVGLSLNLHSIPAPQLDFQEKELKVSLRLIGHELLLASGDSSSLVMPIVANSNTYRLAFENDFALNPDELIYLVDSVMEIKRHVKSYVVEVLECESMDVVYSYSVNGFDNENLSPCRGRPLQKACYQILFTFNKTFENPITNESESTAAIESSLIVDGEEENSTLQKIALLVLVLSIGLTFYLAARKFKKPATNRLVKVGRFHFDENRAELHYEKDKTELSTKEADLLLLLFKSANNTLERDFILNQVWGDEGDYVGRTLDVFISKLRKKLELDPDIKIVNVRGVGYKMVLD
jgi:hypothetical protein